MTSDGTPWRPFVHLLDVAAAVVGVLEAPCDLVHGQVFNVGSSTSNFQIREIAEVVGKLVPGCRLQFGDSRHDKRNYRIDFGKIERTLPGFVCRWDLERGVAELLDVFARTGFDEAAYRWRGYTRLAQIRHLLETSQIDDDFFWTAAA
jgi:nucleoside-diphosphate-sugar epimerase